MIKDTSAQDTRIESASSPWRRWGILTIAALLVAASLLLVPAWQRWASADATMERDLLRFADVTRGDLTRDITAQGTIVAAVKPTLFSPASGVISVAVQAGDAVRLGDLIASVESPELLNLLEQERAALESAETGFKRQQIQARKIQLQNEQVADLAEVALVAAKREQRRAVAAHAQEAISEFDFDKANDDVTLAELRFQHAEQDAKLQAESLTFELQTTELDIEQQKYRVAELVRQVEELQIASPVTGIVGNLLVEHKDAVARNQALLTVVDLTAFEVELAIPDSYAAGLRLGLAVEIRHRGERFKGALRSISPEVRNSQLTTRVAFSDAPPGNLRQNQRVSGRILLDARKDILMVDRGPFLEAGGGRFTYVVDGDLARRQMIETGVASVSAVEIVSGLEPGQTIVISNLDDFRDAEVVYLSN